MSCPRAKAERSKAKDLRQIPAPDGPSNGKKKKRRRGPWCVLERVKPDTPRNSIFRQLFGRDWTVIKRYADPLIAENYVVNMSSKHRDFFEYKVEYQE
jgi:hypothetical protein